jgi:hypothetical protein
VWTAALQTAFGGIVASVIGYFVASKLAAKQQKEQRLNEWILRRNKWADELREHILEVINAATWFHLAKWKSRPSPQGDGTLWDPERENYTMKLTDSITRVCLMIDSEVNAHAELMKALESVRSAAFTSNTKDPAQFENAIQSLIKSACAVVSQVSSETALHLREDRLHPSARLNKPQCDRLDLI